MYKLTTRKIIQISGSHYIALPKNWMINEHVSKGSAVTIGLDDNNQLVISANGASNDTT